MSSNFFKPTRRDVLRAGTGLLVMAPHLVRAQAADAVRFSLEFRIYGGNAPLFLGAERGIFREQGINVSMDGSAGSVVPPYSSWMRNSPGATRLRTACVA